MSCVLRISGTEFDVDAFIAETGWLEVGMDVRKYKKGEYVNHLKRGVRQDSGFVLTISEADFGNFEQQHEETVGFLKKYKDVFELLSKYKVDGWRSFDFGLDTFPPNRFSRTYFLSHELLGLCAEAGLGIVMSNYFTAKRSRRNARAKRKFSSKNKY